ncbi:MAG: response regulator transcription factor [Leptospiraceae bacterium]|nr:response regulator transcription factor [Leptospiraceae bacterium]
MNGKYNIAFIDDHSILLLGIQTVLKKYSFFQNITFFTSYQELKGYLTIHSIDLLVTDITMPDKNGFYIIDEIKTKLPDVKIAVFTQHEGEAYFKDAYKLGINAYILKTEPNAFLPEIFLRVMNGEFYVSPEINKYLRFTQNTECLNPVEHEIINLLTQGKSLKEIGNTLNLSGKVIEYRLKKIRKMFDSKTTAELVFKMKNKYFM